MEDHLFGLSGGRGEGWGKGVFDRGAESARTNFER